jgi:hypothetical protein
MLARDCGTSGAVDLSGAPVHLFSLFDGLLAIAVGGSALLLGLLGSRRPILLYLVALVCNLDAHLALNTRYTQAEVRVVKHVDSESDGLGSEVDCESSEQLTSTWESVAKFTNEGVSIKVAVLVVIHLDTGLIVVDAFGDYAVPGETFEQFLLVDVFGKRLDVDGCVDALLRLFALLLLRSLLRMKSVVIN